METKIKKYFLPYIGMLFVLAVLEYIWFFHIAGEFFKKEISHLMSDDPNIAVATLFYFFYPMAVLIFVHSRTMKIREVLLYGAFFGFTTYFIYDLTNYVTLYAWGLKMAVVDILWGTFITTLISLVGYKIIKKSEN